MAADSGHWNTAYTEKGTTVSWHQTQATTSLNLIAEVAALSGYDVVVRSRSERGATDLVAQVSKSLGRRVERGKLETQVRDDALSRLTTTTNLGDLARCSIVIESVVEDKEQKTTLLRELDSVVPTGSIIATNTSTLSVSELALATSQPDRVCGIHFFNPATTMPLVEVIHPLTASQSTIGEGTCWNRSSTRTPSLRPPSHPFRRAKA